MIIHYKKAISISITLIIIVALLILSFTALADNSNNTQPYKPARFALLAGEVNAAMFNSNGNHTQKVIVNLAPLGIFSSADIVPLIFCTTRVILYKPMPVPPVLLNPNSNILSISQLTNPSPSSAKTVAS